MRPWQPKRAGGRALLLTAMMLVLAAGAASLYGWQPWRGTDQAAGAGAETGAGAGAGAGTGRDHAVAAAAAEAGHAGSARAATGNSGPHPAPAQAAAVETDWFALVPRDWEPEQQFNADMAGLSDQDPRARAALARLRAAWAEAPVEPLMDKLRIRIAGYVIPLDSENGAVSELLLVPYFGACIHAPPPPANQVIRVNLAEPVRKLRMMDAVWVTGTLRVARNRQPDTLGGLIEAVGYDMVAEQVTPYTEP